MTDEEKISELRKWRKTYRRLNKDFEKIESALGSCADWPLWETVWKGFEAYTDTLSRLIGDNDKWLDWFCYENDMGAKGYEAGHGDNVRPIKTLDDLLDLIGRRDDQNTGDTEGVRQL